MELSGLLEQGIVDYANWIWGTPLLMLLTGGGLFFVVYSRMLPYKHLFHAINILRGKHNDVDSEGDINHYEALSTALASTVGMGNIGGVAVAITTGGPGAIFWMWISALIGMITKYFTCTLAVMYRGKDKEGNIQGGPMYVIEEGLGKRWRPLAVFFCLTAMVGVLPVFQANQLTQIIRDVILVPNGIEGTITTDALTGIIITLLVSVVILGGLKRIANVASKLVPLMVVVYFVSVMYILGVNYASIPDSILLIFNDAFTGQAVLGGAVGALIITGAKRAAFSNEAGIGTAPMAHGQTKTNEPVREGLVAMLGPAIDTLIVCTLTALAIIITGVWQSGSADGVTLTVNAFDQAMPVVGKYLLFVSVFIFAITSLFSFSYYGKKSLAFIVGPNRGKYYNILYIISIVFGSVASMRAVISLFDAAYAMMAIPTMVSALLLAPKVMEETKKYFKKLER